MSGRLYFSLGENKSEKVRFAVTLVRLHFPFLLSSHQLLHLPPDGKPMSLHDLQTTSDSATMKATIEL